MLIKANQVNLSEQQSAHRLIVAMYKESVKQIDTLRQQLKDKVSIANPYKVNTDIDVIVEDLRTSKEVAMYLRKMVTHVKMLSKGFDADVKTSDKHMFNELIDTFNFQIEHAITQVKLASGNTWELCDPDDSNTYTFYKQLQDLRKADVKLQKAKKQITTLKNTFK